MNEVGTVPSYYPGVCNLHPGTRMTQVAFIYEEKAMSEHELRSGWRREIRLTFCVHVV